MKRTALSSPANHTPLTGQYFYPVSGGGSGTSALPNGSLRVVQWAILVPTSITRLGVDVSTVGEAGSKYRPGLWADNGANYPSALLVDAGQLAGDSTGWKDGAAVLTLAPGVYWLGGTAQAAATTPPTIRICSGYNPVWPLPLGTSLPTTAVSAMGYFTASGVASSGALPDPFPAGATASATVPRLLAKAA